MAECIIPIQIEGEEENEKAKSDTEEKVSKPMESLNISKPKPTVQIKAQVEQKRNEHEEYLKAFDVFEERDECIAKYTLPNSNVPEKIILVIDRAQDEHYTPFVVDNVKYTPLSMLKRALQIFLKLKRILNPQNEYAIAVLNENNAEWILNFTNDMKKIRNVLNAIKECEVEDTFNLNSLFDEILDNTVLPSNPKADMSPQYLVRTVIFYGRSYTIPKLEPDDRIDNLLKNPFFICDILMTHEPVEISNHCDKIFNALQNLDTKGLAYFFPVCRDSRRLHNSTGKLLSHPLQRAVQKLQKI